MYSEKELRINNKSYINKSFDTIFPELVQLAKQLTNRIDFSSTNESDPLIVLTKLAAFIGDKNSYNSDKNTLEVFLPSATQQTSLNYIAETNGYNVRYYLSSTTNISVSYLNFGSGDGEFNQDITLKPFDTQFTDKEGNVVYTLVNKSLLLNSDQRLDSGKIIQGTPSDLIVNGSTVIQLSNLDGNNRIYFPTTMVAQNGVYVKNNNDNETMWFNEKDGWVQVKNLNLYAPNSKVFKFGFDSDKGLPYIQFPDDIIDIIDSGLNIKYIVTTGVNGNVPMGAINTITQSSLNAYTSTLADGVEFSSEDENGVSYFVVSNIAAATNGANPEDIDEAYFNYKRTIGTFETLITPRDFTNYIFRYVDENNVPIVSNIQVSDRRTDINYAFPIISYSYLGNATIYRFKQDMNNLDAITPFDLVLYPLQYVSTIYNDKTYDATFKQANNIEIIPQTLVNTQSIDHTFLNPSNLEDSVYLYKNYYTLNARVTTTRKVNDVERAAIIADIKLALYNNFNSRKLNYGQEIVYDTLLNTIQNANSLIKNVILDEPSVETKVLTANGDVNFNGDYYLNAVARNVLAGRISLFEYDNSFRYDYGMNNITTNNNIAKIISKLTIDKTKLSSEYTLQPHQVIQLYNDNYSVKNQAVYGVEYKWEGSNVDSNTIYKLLVNDKLTLKTTRPDGKNVRYEYTQTSIKTYDDDTGLLLNEEATVNIIKPNFNLVQLDSYQMLNTNDTISFMSKVEVKLDRTKQSGMYNLYWIMNNPTNNLFPNPEVAGIKETILSEDECLIYTDKKMNQIEVFGAGTKLSTNLVNKDWTIDLSNDISIETINVSDISTYSGINWRQVYFSGNEYLQANQLQVLTLTNGDSIKVELDSDLTLVPQLAENVSYKIGSGETQYLDVYPDDWNIRAKLELDCGPNNAQYIVSDSSVGYEEVVELYELVSGSYQILQLINTNVYLKFSEDITSSGNSDYLIDPDVESISSLTYNFTNPKYTTTSVTNVDIEVNSDGSIDFNLDDLNTTTLTVNIITPIISGKTNYLMIWDGSVSGTLTLANKDAQSTTKTITNLNNSSNNQKGVNTFEFNDGGYLTITLSNSTKLSGSLHISELKVSNGINTILDVNTPSDLMDIITDINTLGGKENQFDYITNVANDKSIDVENFSDASTLWDVNNVLNRFTLPQIDFKNSYIDVLKSSRS